MPRGPQELKAELSAMTKIGNVLNKLDPESQRNVAAYVAEAYGNQQQPSTETPEQREAPKGSPSTTAEKASDFSTK